MYHPAHAPWFHKSIGKACKLWPPRRIWGSRSCSYECCHLLGYSAVQSVCEPTFRRNILLNRLLHAGFLLDWFSTVKMEVILPPKRRFTYVLHGAASQKMATSLWPPRLFIFFPLVCKPHFSPLRIFVPLVYILPDILPESGAPIFVSQIKKT
jgi:hypothetical protein